MSTYYGYVCKSHTPNLHSEHWLNRGDQALTEAYQMERAGEWPNAADGTPDNVEGSRWTNEPILWLRQHPFCTVHLRNEYGDETPLDPPPCTECRKCVGETGLRTAEQTGNWWSALPVRMIVCPGCGNKRCPRASYHGNACTGSNAPGQEDPAADWTI